MQRDQDSNRTHYHPTAPPIHRHTFILVSGEQCFNDHSINNAREKPTPLLCYVLFSFASLVDHVLSVLHQYNQAVALLQSGSYFVLSFRRRQFNNSTFALGTK